MQSLILVTASRYLFPLLLLFSIFMLFRGHNEPGGGFIGGLIAAAGFILYAIAHSVREAERLMRVKPRMLIPVGLLLALSSGLVAPLVSDRPFLTSMWSSIELPGIGTLSTPLLFDVGVYLCVIGVTLLIIFSLAEDS